MPAGLKSVIEPVPVEARVTEPVAAVAITLPFKLMLALVPVELNPTEPALSTPLLAMLLLAFIVSVVPALDGPTLSVPAPLVNIRTEPVPAVLADKLLAAISSLPVCPSPAIVPVPLVRLTVVAVIGACQVTLPDPPAIKLMEFVFASPSAGVTLMVPAKDPALLKVKLPTGLVLAAVKPAESFMPPPRFVMTMVPLLLLPAPAVTRNLPSETENAVELLEFSVMLPPEPRPEPEAFMELTVRVPLALLPADNT